MAEERSAIIQLLIELRDSISEPLERVEEHLEHVHGSFRDLAAAAGEMFIGFEALEHLIGPAEEFQTVQTDLAIALQATAEQLEEFHRQADELSTALPISAEDITKAQQALGQSFGNVKDAMAVTDKVMQVATATHMEAANAAQLLGAVYQQLGDHTKPVEQAFAAIADKMALLLTRFPAAGGSAATMATSFGHVAEAAAAYGVSVDQAMAAVMTLNRVGLGGRRGSGSFVQQAIEELGKLDKNGVPVVHKFGVGLMRTTQGGLNLIATLERLQKNPAGLKRLAQEGGQAGQTIALMVKQLEDLRRNREQAANADGTAKAAADRQNATSKSAWTEMHNALTNLAEVIGTNLLPALTAVAHGLTEIIKAVHDFAEAHPILTDFAAHFAAIAASIMLVQGAFVASVAAIKAFHSAFEAMHLAMMGPWAIAFAALAAVAIVIYQHWDEVKRVAREVRDAFHEIKVSIGEFAESHPILAGMAEQLLGILSTLLAIKAATMAITLMTGAFAGVRLAAAAASTAIAGVAGTTTTLAASIGLLAAQLAALMAAAGVAYGIKLGVETGSGVIERKLFGKERAEGAEHMREQGRQQFLSWFGLGPDKPSEPSPAAREGRPTGNPIAPRADNSAPGAAAPSWPFAAQVPVPASIDQHQDIHYNSQVTVTINQATDTDAVRQQILSALEAHDEQLADRLRNDSRLRLGVPP